MPTLPALESFVGFSSSVVMEVEQTCLCCQFDAHLEKSLQPLILIIIKPPHSKVLPNRIAGNRFQEVDSNRLEST